MSKRVIAVLKLIAVPAAVAVAVPFAASAAPPEGPPNPVNPNAVAPLVPPKPCSYEGSDPYEKRVYKLERWRGPDYTRYPGACERLRFYYGPIVIEPGKNNVLIEPITIQSPRRDGYMTRFEPNLVLQDGTTPPVEQVHLHHGTWLSSNAVTSAGQGLGSFGPFMASGEEKTIGTFPRGYGMPIKASDQWFLLYMVHSAIAKPMVGYITYDIDFVPAAAGEELGIKPVWPMWLDVRHSGYPVFNVQRQYGGKDGKCTWPKQQCADFDPWGRPFEGQGQPGNGLGTDFDFPAPGKPLGPIRNFTGGTLIAIGGHLHPGGLTDQVDLVRGDKSKRIFTSEAVYWKHHHHLNPGGPPTSWDLSMTGTGLPYWAVHVKPGDKLRLNATYDTTHQSSYEDMGIMIAGLAPDTPDGKPTAPGLDPFTAPRDTSGTCRDLRDRITGPASELEGIGLAADTPSLCTRGIVTHGHQAANGNYGGPKGQFSSFPGNPTNHILIADFQYLPGDLSSLSSSGVPTVRLGTNLEFTNLEGALIYHTITTCKYPCMGPTGAAFPIANGATSSGRQIDFDSSEAGIGTPAIGPAKENLNWTTPITKDQGYKPGEVVTYYCRIHPFMRGAFEVTK